MRLPACAYRRSYCGPKAVPTLERVRTGSCNPIGSSKSNGKGGSEEPALRTLLVRHFHPTCLAASSMNFQRYVRSSLDLRRPTAVSGRGRQGTGWLASWVRNSLDDRNPGSVMEGHHYTILIGSGDPEIRSRRYAFPMFGRCSGRSLPRYGYTPDSLASLRSGLERDSVRRSTGMVQRRIPRNLTRSTTHHRLGGLIVVDRIVRAECPPSRISFWQEMSRPPRSANVR